MVSVKSPPYPNKFNMWDMPFSHKCCWGLKSSRTWCCVYMIPDVPTDHVAYIFKGDQLIKNSSWAVWPLRMKAPWSFNMSGTSDLTKQHHIPRDWNPQIQYHFKEKCVTFVPYMTDWLKVRRNVEFSCKNHTLYSKHEMHMLSNSSSWCSLCEGNSVHHCFNTFLSTFLITQRKHMSKLRVVSLLRPYLRF